MLVISLYYTKPSGMVLLAGQLDQHCSERRKEGMRCVTLGEKVHYFCFSTASKKKKKIPTFFICCLATLIRYFHYVALPTKI